LSDIDNHWAKDFIENLIKRGSINGYSDGTFKPDNAITRAEFTKILLASLGTYSGVQTGEHWAYNYMKEALKKGYVLEGEFDNIDSYITRGEIARMIARAINEDIPNIEEYSSQIKDYSTIPENYNEHVLKVYAAGIILGYDDDSFRIQQTATRAEAATIVIRLLDKSKRKLPLLIKEDAVIKGDQVVSVEVKEVTNQYNKILEAVEQVEGSTEAVYVGDMGSIAIYYTSEGQADYNNVTLVIDSYINKNQSGTQYLINIKKFDTKTHNAVKEVLKVLFPQSFQDAYNQLVSLENTKSETENMELDGREFYANYVMQNNSIYVYVGGSEDYAQ
jgi:hypothetical protein